MIYSDLSSKELLAYTGKDDALISVEKLSFTEGPASGLQLIRLKTLTGLELDLLPGRGLDIANLYYKGSKVSFMSKNGLVASGSGNPGPGNFMSGFFGGMLTTCGLRNVGPDCTDLDGEYHPFHGNFSNLLADEISITRPSATTVEISGLIKETALFGHNLKLYRRILLDAKEMSVEVEDKLLNNSPRPEEIMLLYHYNFGFPFLADGVKVIFQSDDLVKPRTCGVDTGIDRLNEIVAPVDDIDEEVYFHLQEAREDGFAYAAVLNEKLGFSAILKYETKELPILTQWKSMASTDYALGLEPTNNYIMGRKKERENKTLQHIGPFEEKTFRSGLKFVDIATVSEIEKLVQ